MENYVELEPVRFSGKRKGILFGIAAYIIFFVLVFADSDIGDGLKILLSGNIKNTPGEYWFFLFVILFVAISLINYIFSYIANCKSYIELTDTHIIMNKPIRYPFSSMEMVYLPYEEVETVKIKPMTSRNNNGLLGYKVIFTKKEEFGNAEVIKFYGLDEAKKFDEELRKRGVNSSYSRSGWNFPPDA